VGEENDPAVANEVVEVNGAIGGVGLEVRRNSAEAETGGETLVSNSWPRLQEQGYIFVCDQEWRQDLRGGALLLGHLEGWLVIKCRAGFGCLFVH
jgi:hypothetical protein